MTRSLSIYLDALRFLAAVAVFLLHANYDRFTGGLPLLWRTAIFGNDAVMLFFVLSGFVIAHVTNSRSDTPSSYWAARLSRLWSVCIPALLLTVVADSIGWRLAPHLYDIAWYGYDHPVARTLASLLFLNELWFWSIHPFSNTPYWSVGYEFWYYAIFGLWYFLTGVRRLFAVAVIALLMGPKILLLLPVWLAGVWAYRTRLTQRLTQRSALVLTIASAAAYLLYRFSGLPDRLDDAASHWIDVRTFNQLGWSKHFLANYLVGFMVALHFVAARALLNHHPDALNRFERPIRYAATFTFSLYLFHNPLLQFFSAVSHAAGIWDQRLIPTVLGPLLLVLLLGKPAERLKGPMKRQLLRVFQRVQERGRHSSH